jgi:molybdate transport system permease protein
MRFSRLATSAAIVVAAMYVGLILSLFHFLHLGTTAQTLAMPRTLFALGLSLVAATLATLFALPLAIPAAYALSRFEFPGKFVAEALLELPLIVSPAALGALLLMFFNQPLGDWIQAHSVQFVFAFWGVVLAQWVTILGMVVRFVKAAFDEVPERYELMARSLGARPFQAFRATTFPLARRGILAGAMLAWAKALGEFGATITFAGTMAMKTETLPGAIYMRLSSADLEGAATLILLLILIGLATLFVIRRLGRGTAHV